MIALWLLAGLGLLCSLVRGGRRLPAATLVLHGSLLLILVGGLCTALLSRQGKMVIRQGSPSERFVLSGGTATDSLPFPIVLRDYGTTYSDEARVFPSDYYAEIEVEGSAHRLSMNKILRHRGYRFFLHALSEESDEVSLLVTYDPIGMYLVYAGFVLLILAFLILQRMFPYFFPIFRKICSWHHTSSFFLPIVISCRIISYSIIMAHFI